MTNKTRLWALTRFKYKQKIALYIANTTNISWKKGKIHLVAFLLFYSTTKKCIRIDFGMLMTSGYFRNESLIPENFYDSVSYKSELLCLLNDSLKTPRGLS